MPRLPPLIWKVWKGLIIFTATLEKVQTNNPFAKVYIKCEAAETALKNNAVRFGGKYSINLAFFWRWRQCSALRQLQCFDSWLIYNARCPDHYTSPCVRGSMMKSSLSHSKTSLRTHKTASMSRSACGNSQQMNLQRVRNPRASKIVY